MPIRGIPQSRFHFVFLLLASLVLVAIGYQWRAAMVVQMDRDSDVYTTGLYPYAGPTEGVDSRWTNGDGFVRLPNPGVAWPAVLTIKARAWRDPTRVFTATVTVNGHPIGEISKADWRDWSFPVTDPALLRSDEFVVGVRTAPWVVSDVFPGSTDHRQVGVEIATVELAPQWGGEGPGAWNALTTPSVAQTLFGMFLAVGVWMLCIALGMAEQRALAAGLVAAASYAICVAFFRIESSHYGVIGAIATAGTVILAGVSEPGLIVSRDRKRIIPQAVLATAVFGVLAVFVCFAIVERMGQSVYGVVGSYDNLYFVWQLGWIQRSLLQMRLPYAVPFLNYPEGWNLAYNEVTPAMNLVALPASLAGGAVFGYNLALLASIVLAGLGMYVWTRRLTGSAAAGLIAGTIYGFLPYHTAHMLGHFNLSGTEWFPFYFMSLGGVVRGRRAGKEGVMAGFFLGLIALTSEYYLLMTAVMTGIFGVGYVLLADRKLVVKAAFWRSILTVSLVAAPMVLIAVVPYLPFAAQGNYIQRSYETASYWSASPTDFFLPAPTHFIWGSWIQQYVNGKPPIESSMYVGLVTLGLAMLALVFRRRGPIAQVILVFALSAVCAFVLALGPELHWLGQTVVVQVPPLLQRLYSEPLAVITLPGYWLYRFLPAYSSMRGSMRYGMYVGLFASVLAGIGAAWLTRNARPRWAIAGTVGAVLLVMFDFYWGTPAYLVVQARPVDYWLAAEPGDGAVAEFPGYKMEEAADVLYADARNKPFVGANFVAYPSPQFLRIQPVMNTFPSATSVAQLKEMGVQWVIVDSDRYGDFGQTKAAIEALGLRYVVQLDGQYVYMLR